MGCGKIGEADTTFCRKFRWTFGSNNLDSSFMKDVKFDFVNKLIKFSYYDVISKNIGMHAMQWAHSLHALPNETLTFKSFDGCGNELYQLDFAGLMITGYDSDFDYESSDVSTSNFEIQYEDCTKNIIACPEHLNVFWKILIEGKEYKAIVPERPSMEVEETPINHLNATSWIPGRAKWMPLEVSLSMPKWSDWDNLPRWNEVFLRFYNGDKLMEQFKLIDVWTSAIDWVENKCKMELRFNSVEFTKNQ